MKIAIYGGSFNPPHLGHVEAANTIVNEICPDRLFIIPASIPPHKALAEGSPSADERFFLTQLAFFSVPGAEVLDIELYREGKCYTADTVEQLKKAFPDDELMFAMGTDMFLSFETWYKFRYLLENLTLLPMARNDGEEGEILRYAEHLEKEYGAKIQCLRHEPKPMSSTDIRAMLSRRMGAEFLPDLVYRQILQHHDYDAKAELYWLREKAHAMLKPNRVAHVIGVESEAVRLANFWGEDPEDAAEAGILHDITKKLLLDDQLILCEKYGIINDIAETENVKLLHAKTGAALARDMFGISDRVFEAIRWHTTGKPDMNLLEKIVYMADYIEPNRDFEGVEKLRELAYENLDEALTLGLEMSLEDIRSYGVEPFRDTVEAYEWYKNSSER